jgi:hypothetical protein
MEKLRVCINILNTKADESGQGTVSVWMQLEIIEDASPRSLALSRFFAFITVKSCFPDLHPICSALPSVNH